MPVIYCDRFNPPTFRPECDRCRLCHGLHASPADAELAAVSAGWFVGPAGEVLCPACFAADGRADGRLPGPDGMPAP